VARDRLLHQISWNQHVDNAALDERGHPFNPGS